MMILSGRAAFKTALGLSRLFPAAVLALSPAAPAAGDPRGPAAGSGSAAAAAVAPPAPAPATVCVADGARPSLRGSAVTDDLVFAAAHAALAAASPSRTAPQLFYEEENGEVYLFVDAGVFEPYLSAGPAPAPSACGARPGW